MQRYIMLTFMSAGSILLIVGGHNGMKHGATPLHYYGYPFGVICIVGLLGFNIWYGGPLDKRLDKPEDDHPSN